MSERAFVPWEDKGYASHSSINTFNQCQTRFYKQYVEGKSSPSSPAQRLGTAWGNIIDSCVQMQADSYPTQRLAVENVMQEWHDDASNEDDEYYAKNWHAVFNVLMPAYIERYGLDDSREVEFTIPTKHGNVHGLFDGIFEGGIAEDKLNTRYYFNAGAISALNTNQQIMLYLWAARECGYTPRLEYRVTLKPTIGMRRKQKPETMQQYEDRLAEDVMDNPGSYFWSKVYTKTDEQLDAFIESYQSAHFLANKVAAKEIHPTRNTSACSMYGGCPFINECS